MNRRTARKTQAPLNRRRKGPGSGAMNRHTARRAQAQARYGRHISLGKEISRRTFHRTQAQARLFSRKGRRARKGPPHDGRRPSPHRTPSRWTGHPTSFALSALSTLAVNPGSCARCKPHRPSPPCAVRRTRAPARGPESVGGRRQSPPCAVRRTAAPAARNVLARKNTNAKFSAIIRPPAALCGLCLFALAACAPKDANLAGGASPTQPDSAPIEAIEPLPSFAAPAPVVYSAAGRRSPFDAPTSQATPKAAPSNGLAPDPHRQRQHLEEFPLASLTLVGTLAQGRVRQGLVRDEDGRVHPVRLGDYLGADHGRVSRIEQGAIEVTELISNGEGNWTERRQTLQTAPAQAAP